MIKITMVSKSGVRYPLDIETMEDANVLLDAIETPVSEWVVIHNHKGEPFFRIRPQEIEAVEILEVL